MSAQSKQRRMQSRKAPRSRKPKAAQQQNGEPMVMLGFPLSELAMLQVVCQRSQIPEAQGKLKLGAAQARIDGAIEDVLKQAGQPQSE